MKNFFLKLSAWEWLCLLLLSPLWIVVGVGLFVLFVVITSSNAFINLLDPEYHTGEDNGC